MRPHIALILALGIILIPREAFCSPVTESFSGTATLVSPGDLGDAGTDIFSMNVLRTEGLATVSYDLSIRAASGLTDSGGNSGLHFDSRGFGDTAGPSDAIDSSWFQRELMEVRVSNLQVTAAAGFEILSHDIEVEIDSFDLVNHNSNNPTVFWIDQNNNFSFETGTGGTSGAAETVSVAPGATELDIYGLRRRAWIDNVVSWHQGNAVVIASVTAVPEPNTFVLGVVSVVAVLRRSKRQE